MVKINRIYTRTGDDGTTGLVGGARAPKDSKRVSAYGDLDELNSFIGLARTYCDRDGRCAPLSAALAKIQNKLFDLGAELATPPGETPRGYSALDEGAAAELERAIDDLCADLPELRSFVLPGGSEANSFLHIARTVCRRAERNVIELSRSEPVNQNIIIYLNRLSDLLFAMSRAAAKLQGAAEYLWVPNAAKPSGG